MELNSSMSVKGDLSSSEKQLFNVITTGKPLPVMPDNLQTGSGSWYDRPYYDRREAEIYIPI